MGYGLKRRLGHFTILNIGLTSLPNLHTYACKDTPTLVKSKIIVGQIAVRGSEWLLNGCAAGEEPTSCPASGWRGA